jgi:vanadium-dependent haloperoxidase-like protein
MSRHYANRSLACLVLLVGLTARSAKADVVTDWNSVAMDAGIAAREPQPIQARSVTMVHVAMFEAINAIEQRYKPYVVKVSPSSGASREAAAAAAAHAILTKLYPDQSASFDKALTGSLSQMADGEAKRSGVSLGERVAQEIHKTRAAEMANSPNTYRPITEPGVYVPTTLPVATDASRFKPWLMQEPAQFRPEAPVPLQSAQWARDYNEIKEMGGRDSTKRTSEQTAIGRFWIVTGPPAWNPVIRAIVATKKLSLVENARLFALAHMAGADAYIAVFEAKYAYHFWRPITAIRNGDIDGNADTIHDPAWIPLIDTPMHPEYPCAHCITAAAVATVLKSEFGSGPIGPIAMTSPTAPGVTRTWHSIEDYVTDVKNARIWAGVHYRFSTEVGATMGRKIGDLASRDYMMVAAQ